MFTRILRFLLRFALRALIAVAVLAALGLGWLRLESHQSQTAYMDQRHGQLADASIQAEDAGTARENLSVTLTSDSGLSLFLRVLRDGRDDGPRPVLMILGGHRTGRDAVDLFRAPGEYAVVALDYPYQGRERVRGAAQVIETLPKARQAFRDTPPAVSLALDWLGQQDWASRQIVLVGASLGVPFAAKAAARDERISGVLLVHGAADNERWLTLQVARRVEQAWLHRPLGVLLHWMAYGPTFDTAKNIAAVAPRPVLVIGAREDERTPPDEVEALFAAAGQPKRLRWTEGLHIEPDRTEVLDQMMAIAAEELPFLLAPAP
ncbi:MAG: hypothetical protein AAFU65_05200 [Pseudomonadota bacterium]